MNSETFSIKKLFQMVKEERPMVLILGTHHYVQMSETNVEDVGIRSNDLDSVLLFSPVGASVPIVCGKQLKKMFCNMKVYYCIKNVRLLLKKC